MASMRDEMPQCAAWIDELRTAFGAEAIDGAIRAGMRGQPTFHAEEAGHSLGTPIGVGDFSVEVGVEMPARWSR